MARLDELDSILEDGLLVLEVCRYISTLSPRSLLVPQLQPVALFPGASVVCAVVRAVCSILPRHMLPPSAVAAVTHSQQCQNRRPRTAVEMCIMQFEKNSHSQVACMQLAEFLQAPMSSTAKRMWARLEHVSCPLNHVEMHQICQKLYGPPVRVTSRAVSDSLWEHFLPVPKSELPGCLTAAVLSEHGPAIWPAVFRQVIGPSHELALCAETVSDIAIFPATAAALPHIEGLRMLHIELGSWCMHNDCALACVEAALQCICGNHNISISGLHLNVQHADSQAASIDQRSTLFNMQALQRLPRIMQFAAEHGLQSMDFTLNTYEDTSTLTEFWQSAVPALHQLQSLSISMSGVRDEQPWLSQISRLHALTLLEIESDREIDEVGLLAWDVPCLQVLQLRLDNMPNMVLPTIGRLTNLQALQAGWALCSNDKACEWFCKHAEQLTQLKNLDLDDDASRRVWDVSGLVQVMHSLVHLTGLTSLTIKWVRGNTACAAALAQSVTALKALQDFKWRGDLAGDDGARALGGALQHVSSIVDLELTDMGVCGVRAVAGMSALTSLILTENEDDLNCDEYMQLLTDSLCGHSLRSLYVEIFHATPESMCDAGLRNLAKQLQRDMKELRHIHFDLPIVPAAGKALVTRLVPQVQVNLQAKGLKQMWVELHAQLPHVTWVAEQAQRKWHW